MSHEYRVPTTKVCFTPVVTSSEEPRIRSASEGSARTCGQHRIRNVRSVRRRDRSCSWIRVIKMSDKGNEELAPWEEQARQKLALFVYEYLVYAGAPEAARQFLSEIEWRPNIQPGERPGFLFPWFCIFWDLYCAAPVRQDSASVVSSSYGVNRTAHNVDPASNPPGQLPPNQGMPGGPIAPPGFVPNSSARPSHPSSGQSPHPQLPNSCARMLSGQPSIRPLSQGVGNASIGPYGQPMTPSSMYSTWQAVRDMSPMWLPRGPGMGPMGVGPYGRDMRGLPSHSNQGPGAMAPGNGPPQPPNGPMPMNYPSSSTGSHGGPPGPSGTAGGEGKMNPPMPPRTQ